MSDEEKICHRCRGACCFLKDKDKKPTTQPCRYLIFLPSGKTLCRIYRNRFSKTGQGNICIEREQDHHNYKGCPYNRPGWGQEIEVYTR